MMNQKEKNTEYAEALRLQITEHEIAAEKDKLMKKQEGIHANELAKTAQEKDLQAFEKKQREKAELHKTMYEQMENSLKKKKQNQMLEEELDKAYNQLSVDDVERERLRILQSKEISENMISQKEKNLEYGEALRLQITEHEIAAEKDKLMKKQEGIHANELAKTAREEDLQAFDKKQREKAELHKTMYEQMENSLKKKKQNQMLEKERDKAYNQFSVDGVERERLQILQSKSRTKQDSLEYMEHFRNAKALRDQQSEASAELCEMECKKINEKQMESEQMELEARDKLVKEFYEERKQQVIDNQKILMDEMKLEEEELKYAETYANRQDAAQDAMKKQANADNVEYYIQLQKQIADNKDLKKQEKLEETQFLKHQETQFNLEKQKVNEFNSKPHQHPSSQQEPFYGILKPKQY